MQKKPFLLLIIMLLIKAFSLNAYAEIQHEFLFFASAEGANKILGPNEKPKSPDGILSADILYSLSWDRFRFLGEYLASNKETELERLQAGWSFGDENLVWIGRFHVPSNIWATSYHHGQYLQTSISTPGIVNFEDFGGVLPFHSTGLLIDTAHVFDDSSGIKAAFSVGSAPVLEDNFLHSFDLLDPQSKHDKAFHLSFSYLPDYFQNNKIGVNASFAVIDAEDTFLKGQQIKEIEQLSIGAFVDWNWKKWHFISTVSHVMNRLKGAKSTIDDSFTSGFFQAEYEFNKDWTLFGRVEESIDASDSQYLELIPNFVKSRQMLGARFDFMESQALTLEIANIDTENDDFGQVRIQWSAVFP